MGSEYSLGSAKAAVAAPRAPETPALGKLERAASQSHWARAWRRLRRNRLAMVCLVIIVMMFLVAIFAPLLAPYDYSEQNLRNVRQAPSLAHLFGTDMYGRDQFSRIIWGARTAAIVATVPVIIALFLGITAGLASGYSGGLVDSAIMRFADFLLAFPGMLLAILLAATIRPRVTEFVRSFEASVGIKGLASSGMVDYLFILVIFAIIGWTGLARMIRSIVLKLRNEDFVLAARAMGASQWRILFRHLLPNTSSIIVVITSGAMGGAIMAESLLSYLGIGILDPTPSWGQMINANAAAWRTSEFYLLYIPSLIVAIMIFAFNLFGDALNDALNPRTR